MKKFNIKKILVPTDFSETAANALRQAIFVAKSKNASIKLLHVIHQVYITGSELTVPYGPAFFNKLQKTATAHLKEMAAEITKTSGVPISYEVLMGEVETIVNTIAKKEKFDLIIMGTHGTSGVKEFFIGSNAYKVVHNATCPVITIQKKIKGGFKNIILPIRLEIASRQKVDYAMEIAKVFGSTIHITGFTTLNDKASKTKVKQYVHQVEKYLKDNGVKYTSTSIFADNFIAEILKYAKQQKADLLTIMNDNDLSLDQLIKGPYAKQLINHSNIPVLSVPLSIETDLSFYPYLSGQLPA